MTKSSAASTPKNPTPLPPKSASSTAPSPSSQSPAPSSPVLPYHFRPSTLSLSIPIEDGVSIPRNNLGAVKQDDISAPIPSSCTAVPPTDFEGVKTFGSVPVATGQGHAYGKSSISSIASVVPPSASTSYTNTNHFTARLVDKIIKFWYQDEQTAASSDLSDAPLAKPKIDIKKMFQSPSSSPTSNAPPDTSSPSMQNMGFHTQPMWYYQYPADQTHYMPHYQQWFNPTQIPPQHHPPPHHPHPGSQMPPTGLSVSSQNLPSTVHNPSSPTSTPTPQMTAVPSPQNVVLRQGSPGTPNRRPSIRIETEDHYRSRLAEREQNDREKEKVEVEAERKTKVAEEIRNLKLAARLEKAQKELRRQQETRRLLMEAEALELQRLEEEEERKLNQEEEHILKAKRKEEKALRLAQERAKEENEREENEEQEEPEEESNKNMNPMRNVDPVVSPQATENRWDWKAIQVDQDSPELVERKVKSLLNNLTMKNFVSISDQIIAWANKSEKEKDGRTLIQVSRLVFEKATDDATRSEMYARLCRKMMEKISTNVQDEGIRNNKGNPIAGGQLFRKYLLNRCQEDFERGWVAKVEDEVTKSTNAKTKEGGTEEIVRYSEEYYAAQKAKRQGLGLVKFIGELFKLQMLTERIMHECIKKLLGNVDNPAEEEIESLCMLLATVGSMLDMQKTRHMDVYFSRIKELMKSPNVTSRMKYILQDLIELRERKWLARNVVAAPTTIAQIHEKAAQENESYQRQISMSRGGLRRGAQERTKEGKEWKEKEEREEQGRLSEMAEEVRLGMEEEATAKAKAEAILISEPEPEERDEGEVKAQKSYGKQDGQLEDGKDVDTETSNSIEDGKDIPKDGLRIVEKSMMIHLAEDRASESTSRNRAISLVQEQEDGLSTDQKIAMISCFMEDVVAANTYVLLTDPGVRRGWILKMLKKWPM